MTTSMFHDAMWTTASADIEAENSERRRVAARVACAEVWPFLAGAETPEDYINRKEMVADKLDAAVAKVADGADFAVTRHALEASLDDDFHILHRARLEEQGRETQRVNARRAFDRRQAEARRKAAQGSGNPLGARNAAIWNGFTPDDAMTLMNAGYVCDMCADGYHDQCDGKAGTDNCNCPFCFPGKAPAGPAEEGAWGQVNQSFSNRQATAADKYRVVPSEKAGYGPGKHVVQKWYPDNKLWHDVGDPHDTVESAQEKINKERTAARQASRFSYKVAEGIDIEDSADMVAAMIRTNGGLDVQIEKEASSGNVIITTSNDMSDSWNGDLGYRVRATNALGAANITFTAARKTAVNLVRGDKLPTAVKQEVLRSFPYRWTSDNAQRVSAYGACPLCDITEPYVNTQSANGHNHPTMPLVSDEAWLADHAFYVTNDGSALVRNRMHAEPGFMAEGSLQGTGRKVTAAPVDGETSYCRICGIAMEGQDYSWYALSASSPKRDVGEHVHLPARLEGRAGEFGPDGKLVPGVPGGGGGQYDSPAGTIYDGAAKAITIPMDQTTGALKQAGENPFAKKDDSKPDTSKSDAPPADKAPVDKPDDKPAEAPEGGSVTPDQMQAGQKVSLNYTMPDGTAGTCPATFESTDGTTYFFTAETGRFGVTGDGSTWTDINGATFTFDAQADVAPPADPNAVPPAQPPTPPAKEKAASLRSRFRVARGGMYGTCPKCGSGRYNKVAKVCTQCGYKKASRKQGSYEDALAFANQSWSGIYNGYRYRDDSDGSSVWRFNLHSPDGDPVFIIEHADGTFEDATNWSGRTSSRANPKGGVARAAQGRVASVINVNAWADSFGNWKAAVTTDGSVGSEAEAEEAALAEIRSQLADREGPGFAPEVVGVALAHRDSFGGQLAFYYDEVNANEGGEGYYGSRVVAEDHSHSFLDDNPVGPAWDGSRGPETDHVGDTDGGKHRGPKSECPLCVTSARNRDTVRHPTDLAYHVQEMHTDGAGWDHLNSMFESDLRDYHTQLHQQQVFKKQHPADHGVKYAATPGPVSCEQCSGTGKVRRRVPTNGIDKMETCWACGGSGKKADQRNMPTAMSREANPYQPGGNPYSTKTPESPGMPDDELDGPSNSTPMTTRPRQMPSGGNNDMMSAPTMAEPQKQQSVTQGFASRHTAVSASELNSLVEFDSPFVVTPEGEVNTSLMGFYAPEVYEEVDADGQAIGDPHIEGNDWEFVDGYSGQSGYSGPVMHPSEYLGGAMAQDVLDNPGIYVVVAVYPMGPSEEDESEPDGWALLKRKEV